MKDFKNFNEITTRMVEFTDKAPAHLQGRKIPMVCGFHTQDISFDARFDMSSLIAYEYGDAEYGNKDLPTINDLIKDGVVVEWKPFKEAELCNIEKNRKYFAKGVPKIEAIKAYFKERGFNVSTDAITHNFEAWECDYKSGYRDDVNNCHVFSPCGCNPFSLYVSELYADCDWQTTYTC